MSTAYQQLFAVVHRCLETDIKPKGLPTIKSATTQSDYLKLAASLIRRGESQDGGLVQLVQSTERSTTFYKRLAALRYHCHMRMLSLSSQLPQALNDVAQKLLCTEFSQLLLQMRALVVLQDQGMVQPRRKRRSKRQALHGLPHDWRTSIFQRGECGKYALALLVSSLTGARPHELVQGIDVWSAYDPTLGQSVICLRLRGAKVKEKQGQPNRFISYSINDGHPLVTAMAQRLSAAPDGKLSVQISNGGNFTKEIQRLGRSLWPAHPHEITAYCFRHQWSADVKASGNADAVSRGLGHQSAKTRRYYGTANQGSSAQRLRPVRIDADRPVIGLRPQHFPSPSSQLLPQPA